MSPDVALGNGFCSVVPQFLLTPDEQEAAGRWLSRFPSCRNRTGTGFKNTLWGLLVLFLPT